MTDKAIQRFVGVGIKADRIQRQWAYTASLGARLREKSSKRYFLDFHTGFGSLPLGWNHPKLIREARKWSKYDLVNKISNSDFYSEPLYGFAEQMLQTVPKDDGYDTVFLIDGGSAAIDVAIKACMDRWGRLHGSRFSEDAGTAVLHLSNCFHGRNGYPLSLTDTDPVKTRGFHRHEWPKIAAPTTEARTPEVRCALEECEQIMRTRPICGLVVEGCIQCEGGDRHLSHGFLEGLGSLASSYDVPIVCDEIQVGFYATGRPWGHMHTPMKPDAVVFGKKTQQCGVLARGLLSGSDSAFSLPGRLSSTWGGNNVDMLRGAAVARICREDNLGANAAHLGHVFVDKATALASETTGGSLIAHPRALGCIMAFDLPSSALRDLFVALAEESGLLCLPGGERTVRFRPHLAATTGDVEECLHICNMVLCRIIEVAQLDGEWPHGGSQQALRAS